MPKPKRAGGKDARLSSAALDRKAGAGDRCSCHLGADVRCEYCRALEAAAAAKDGAGGEKIDMKLSSALFREGES